MKRAAAIVADSEVDEARPRDVHRPVPRHRITVIAPGLNQPFAPDAARGAEAAPAPQKLGDGPLVLHIGRTFCKNISERRLASVAALRAQGVPARSSCARAGRSAAPSGPSPSSLRIVGAVVELRGVADDELSGALQRRRPAAVPVALRGLRVAAARGDGLRNARGLLALRLARRRRGRRRAHGATPRTSGTAHLASAGTVLGDEKIRRSLIERGLAHARQFSWERTAAQLIDVYNDVRAKGA